MAAQEKPGLFSQLGGKTNSFTGWLKSIPDKASDLGRTNYELALQFLANGQTADAKFRLQVALRFKPQMYQAWYHLGNCLLNEGKDAEAVNAFRQALRIKPDYEEARFMYALMNPNTPAELKPHTFPVALVIGQFSLQAPDYDMIQQELKYCAHQSLYDAVKPLLPPGSQTHALDIGCGTGLLGILLRQHTEQLVGVDITPAMADYAITRYDSNKNRIYDNTAVEDLRDYMLRQEIPAYSLITAASVISYVGGLAAVFDGVNKALQPGGLFAFTADLWPNEGYGLIRELERFGHSDHYIRQQAARTGLQEVSIRPCKLSEEEDGLVCILRKPA